MGSILKFTKPSLSYRLLLRSLLCIFLSGRLLIKTGFTVLDEFQECVISDCGEIPEGEDDGFVVDDGTGDKYADFPSDSGIDFLSVSDG